MTIMATSFLWWVKLISSCILSWLFFLNFVSILFIILSISSVSCVGIQGRHVSLMRFLQEFFLLNKLISEIRYRFDLNFWNYFTYLEIHLCHLRFAYSTRAFSGAGEAKPLVLSHDIKYIRGFLIESDEQTSQAEISRTVWFSAM